MRHGREFSGTPEPRATQAMASGPPDHSSTPAFRTSGTPGACANDRRVLGCSSTPEVRKTRQDGEFSLPERVFRGSGRLPALPLDLPGVDLSPGIPEDCGSFVGVEGPDTGISGIRGSTRNPFRAPGRPEPYPRPGATPHGPGSGHCREVTSPAD